MKMRRIKFTLIYIALIAMSIYGVCGGLHKNDLAGAIGIASMFCLVFITTGLYFEHCDKQN